MHDSMETNENTLPSFIEFLSDTDRHRYLELKQTLTGSDFRYNRHKRIQTFQEMLDDLYHFCKRDDDDDWKRYLVCGILWLGSDCAINTRQLRIVLGKSKSSINGAFVKMGYETLSPKDVNMNILYDKIPFLRDNFVESRQWTFRKAPEKLVREPPRLLFFDHVPVLPEGQIRQGSFNFYHRYPQEPFFSPIYAMPPPGYGVPPNYQVWNHENVNMFRNSVSNTRAQIIPEQIPIDTNHGVEYKQEVESKDNLVPDSTTDAEFDLFNDDTDSDIFDGLRF